MMGGSYATHPEDLDVSDATFARPDLTTFCRHGARECAVDRGSRRATSLRSRCSRGALVGRCRRRQTRGRCHDRSAMMLRPGPLLRIDDD
jgi:hypothetical protein